jgi:hypothetical protein
LYIGHNGGAGLTMCPRPSGRSSRRRSSWLGAAVVQVLGLGWIVRRMTCKDSGPIAGDMNARKPPVGRSPFSSGEHPLDPVENQVETEIELVAEVVAGLQVVGRRHVDEMRVLALGHPFHD